MRILYTEQTYFAESFYDSHNLWEMGNRCQIHSENPSSFVCYQASNPCISMPKITTQQNLVYSTRKRGKFCKLASSFIQWGGEVPLLSLKKVSTLKGCFFGGAKKLHSWAFREYRRLNVLEVDRIYWEFDLPIKSRSKSTKWKTFLPRFFWF